jgi:E3 ubiquitin-protein ligase RNF144
LIDKFNPDRNTTTTMLDLVSMFADDRAMAKDLQLQEVLQFSTQSERVCDVCKKVFPSSEGFWQPENCHHAICIACFCQFAPEPEATGLPRCVVASCESSRMSEEQQGKDAFHDTFTSFEDLDGRKGKEPCDGMFQELGQCSCGASSDFYCTICMESVHVREFFPIAGCTHTFCVSCVGQYIAAKVEENVLSIGCPDPGCKDGTLHPEECRDVIPFQVFQRWGAALRDSALGTLKFYCPFMDCSALLVDDHGCGEAAITKAECPHCSRLFCAQCKVAWHDGVDCAEFQQLGKDERGNDDLLLRKVAKDKKWQRCPKCKMYVERVDGCVYIVCRCCFAACSPNIIVCRVQLTLMVFFILQIFRCQYCFCYLCGSPMTMGDHHCSRCQRTW